MGEVRHKAGKSQIPESAELALAGPVIRAIMAHHLAASVRAEAWAPAAVTDPEEASALAEASAPAEVSDLTGASAPVEASTLQTTSGLAEVSGLAEASALAEVSVPAVASVLPGASAVTPAGLGPGVVIDVVEDEDGIATTMTRADRALAASGPMDSGAPMAAVSASPPATAWALAVSTYLPGACCRACYPRITVDLKAPTSRLSALTVQRTTDGIIIRMILTKITITVHVKTIWSITVNKIWVPVGRTVSAWTRTAWVCRRRTAPGGTMTARGITDCEQLRFVLFKPIPTHIHNAT